MDLRSRSPESSISDSFNELPGELWGCYPKHQTHFCIPNLPRIFNFWIFMLANIHPAMRRMNTAMEYLSGITSETIATDARCGYTVRNVDLRKSSNFMLQESVAPFTHPACDRVPCRDKATWWLINLTSVHRHQLLGFEAQVVYWTCCDFVGVGWSGVGEVGPEVSAINLKHYKPSNQERQVMPGGLL